MAYEFEGVQYGKLRDMQEARRTWYVQLLEEGLNFTQAAHAVGVKRMPAFSSSAWRARLAACMSRSRSYTTPSNS